MSNEAWRNAQIGFARHLIQAGRLDVAQDALGAIEGAAPDVPLARIWCELGSALFALERYYETETAFLAALSLLPEDAEASLGLGYALFNQARLQEAAALFEGLAARPEAGAAAFRALGAARLNLFDTGGAGEALIKALSLDENDAESHALKGVLAYRSANVELRWRDWTRQNLADPKARPDFTASVLAKPALESALESIEAARRIDPRIRTDELGARLLVASGRPEAALQFLAESPVPDARTWQLMADVSWLLRDEVQAKAYLRKSFETRSEQTAQPIGLGVLNESLPLVAAGLEKRRQATVSGTPLVWVHWDAPPHFAQSVAGAVACCPNSPLAVIGDSSNAFAVCRHRQMVSCASSAWEFLERYQHRSENDFVYEAFCLMRWFLLRDWAEAERVEQLMTLDSDILLFADAEREIVPRLGGHDFAFTGPMGPHLCLLTRNGLRELCGFFMDSYAKTIPQSQDQTTDMTLLPRFLANRAWSDLSAVKDGARVDMNIRQSEGFDMAGEAKDIQFKEGRAYARRSGTNERVRFLALHFQGPAKHLMRTALTS
ncbi:MAG: tetratricopeptide repeat protein [Rhodospirillales bacterium]|nr:MAG: tetratricopeptide repeat protein [Rhodospirillales bacterium]